MPKVALTSTYNDTLAAALIGLLSHLYSIPEWSRIITEKLICNSSRSDVSSSHSNSYIALLALLGGVTNKVRLGGQISTSDSTVEGVVTCIRPDAGQLHVKQNESADHLLAVNLSNARPLEASMLEVRLLATTDRAVLSLGQLLLVSTREMRRTDEFDREYLKEQQLKLLEIRAARTLLTDQQLLKQLLTCSVAVIIYTFTLRM